jgi:hypothetical protein
MIDQDDPNKSFKTPLAWAQALYPLVGLIAGAVCMIDGANLFLSAVNEPAYRNGTGADALLSCLPGTMLFIVGFFLAYLTKARMQSRKDRPS